MSNPSIQSPVSHDFLDEIGPLLSEESYQTLLAEAKQLKKAAPRASGIGVDHLQSMPRALNECQEKIRLLQERLKWTRQMCYFLELLERDARRQKEVLVKENKQLREANEVLHTEVKRARAQLQTVLGFKKSPKKKKIDGVSEHNERDHTLKNGKPKKRGAPKGHRGNCRPLPDKVDTIVHVPPPDHCPHCGHHDIRTEEGCISKYCEDIPPIVKRVEERRYQFGSCAHCGGSVIAPEALNGPPVKIGDNLIALLTVMRHRMGSSLRKLSQLCTETFHIPLTPAGVLGILDRVCLKMGPVYKGIEASLPTQAVVSADETGWRMDGQRWNLWIFCNEQIVYFHADPSRGSKVPQSILGSDFQGILSADFYAAYNFVDKTQRCLIHLLRTIHEEHELRPDDTILQKIHDGICFLIVKGLIVKKMEHSQKRQKLRQQLDKKLHSLTKLTSKNKKTQALIKRIDRYRHDLLRFVDHPAVEYHNNRAERGIRPAVIFRKVSFGNRTIRGTVNYSILSSTLETCRLKRKDLTAFVGSVLKTPPSQLHLITRSLLAPS